MTQLLESIRREVEAALSERAEESLSVSSSRQLGGGCIHEARLLELSSGGRAFLKLGCDQPGLYAAEAEGLSALALATPLRVPRVLGCSDRWLALEYIEAGPVGASFAGLLGAGLAALHEPRTEAYGWPRDNWIGPLAQQNAPLESWGSFWAERRLLPQLERAFGAHALARAPLWNDLMQRVPTLLPEGPPPALLHGDLWSGNVFSDAAGVPVLIDPAAYVGHAEVDRAMMELFGGFPAEALPGGSLTAGDPGYIEVRQPIYTLYPLLVHVNLFGGHYAGAALRAARRALSG